MAQTLGFIGLGNMGNGMARNLMRKGYHLRLFNRSQEKARALLTENSVLCATAAEAAESVSLVISMLSDDAAVKETVAGKWGILEGLARDGIHLSMSTLNPSASRELSQRHIQHGSYYLAAPVFGRPSAAEAGKLHLLLSGGSPEKRQSMLPVLNAIGQSVWDFGDDPGAANIVKVCGNFMAFSANQAMAEAFTIAERHGIERHAIYEMLTSTLFDTPAYKAYGLMVASENYEPAGFSLPLGLKDIGIFTELGRESKTVLPLGNLIAGRMRSAAEKGRDHLDAAVFAQEVSDVAAEKNA